MNSIHFPTPQIHTLQTASVDGFCFCSVKKWVVEKVLLKRSAKTAVNTKYFFYILFVNFFDGLTEEYNKIKKINKLTSVKTPSKLRQNEKKLTDNAIFCHKIAQILTVCKFQIFKYLAARSVKLRQNRFLT